MTFVGAVDLGGTKILAGVFDIRGLGSASQSSSDPVRGPGGVDRWRPVVRRKIPTRSEEGADRVIGRMADLVSGLAREAGVTLSRVGVASPGPLNHRTGVVIQAPNLGWRRVPLADKLRSRLGVPVLVDHDGNLAALAEWSVRAVEAARATGHARPRGYAPDPLVYVTVSTGIGGGIVSGGEVLHGFRGAAGEVGHLTLAPGGPACNCGNRGCLEALASGPALARLARERWGRRPGGTRDGSRGDRPGGGGEERGQDIRTAEDVARLWAEGDPQAATLVAEAARWLGLGLASVAAVIDPEVIVLGGGVLAGLGSGFLDLAREEMRARLMPHAWEGDVPAIEPARLGGDAALLGTAILAWR